MSTGTVFWMYCKYMRGNYVRAEACNSRDFTSLHCKVHRMEWFFFFLSFASPIMVYSLHIFFITLQFSITVLWQNMQATNILYLFRRSCNWLSVLSSLKSNLVTSHVWAQNRVVEHPFTLINVLRHPFDKLFRRISYFYCLPACAISMLRRNIMTMRHHSSLLST